MGFSAGHAGDIDPPENGHDRMSSAQVGSQSTSTAGGTPTASASDTAAALDLSDWSDEELLDPLAQALLGFAIEDGVVVPCGRSVRSFEASHEEANAPTYSEVPPWTPGQTFLPRNPMVLKRTVKHSPARVSDALLSDIFLRCSQRDIAILIALSAYRYLNVFQIQQLFFPTASMRFCQMTLKHLDDRGLIHRWKILEAANFHRRPSVVLLSVRGARIVALYLDDDPKPYMSRAEDALYNSAGLVHDLEVNQLFVDLARASASRAAEGLYDWVGEARCRQAMREGHYRFAPAAAPAPDGWGRYLMPDGEVRFYVEWERGTASGRRQWDKIQSYCHHFRYFHDSELMNVLFVAPDERRSDRLRNMLWRATSPRLHERTCTFWVASAEALWEAGPLEPLWHGPAPRRTSAARPYTPEPPRSLMQLRSRARSEVDVGSCVAKENWWERRPGGPAVP